MHVVAGICNNFDLRPAASCGRCIGNLYVFSVLFTNNEKHISAYLVKLLPERRLNTGTHQLQ